MLAREHLLALAPRAKESYLAATTDPDWGAAMMQRFEILENANRFVFFMANGMHETGALTIEAENMSYSAPRMKVVWPTRFDWGRVSALRAKGKTVAGPATQAEFEVWVQSLANNPDALAAVTYNGRMGNRPGSQDGAFFRGRGFLQVTGRNAYLKYGQYVGIDFDAQPEYVQSMHAMFGVSCAEVYIEGLNQIADEGDFDGYAAKLNTGGRLNVTACVGLDDRRKWRRKIETFLAGNPEMDDPPAALVAECDLTPGQDEHWLEHDEEEAEAA